MRKLERKRKEREKNWQKKKFQWAPPKICALSCATFLLWNYVGWSYSVPSQQELRSNSYDPLLCRTDPETTNWRIVILLANWSTGCAVLFEVSNFTVVHTIGLALRLVWDLAVPVALISKYVTLVSHLLPWGVIHLLKNINYSHIYDIHSPPPFHLYTL